MTYQEDITNAKLKIDDDIDKYYKLYMEKLDNNVDVKNDIELTELNTEIKNNIIKYHSFSYKILEDEPDIDKKMITQACNIIDNYTFKENKSSSLIDLLTSTIEETNNLDTVVLNEVNQIFNKYLNQMDNIYVPATFVIQLANELQTEYLNDNSKITIEVKDDLNKLYTSKTEELKDLGLSYNSSVGFTKVKDYTMEDINDKNKKLNDSINELYNNYKNKTREEYVPIAQESNDLKYIDDTLMKQIDKNYKASKEKLTNNFNSYATQIKTTSIIPKSIVSKIDSMGNEITTPLNKINNIGKNTKEIYNKALANNKDSYLKTSNVKQDVNKIRLAVLSHSTKLDKDNNTSLSKLKDNSKILTSKYGKNANDITLLADNIGKAFDYMKKNYIKKVNDTFTAYSNSILGLFMPKQEAQAVTELMKGMTKTVIKQVLDDGNLFLKQLQQSEMDRLHFNLSFLDYLKDSSSGLSKNMDDALNNYFDDLFKAIGSDFGEPGKLLEKAYIDSKSFAEGIDLLNTIAQNGVHEKVQSVIDNFNQGYNEFLLALAIKENIDEKTKKDLGQYIYNMLDNFAKFEINSCNEINNAYNAYKENEKNKDYKNVSQMDKEIDKVNLNLKDKISDINNDTKEKNKNEVNKYQNLLHERSIESDEAYTGINDLNNQSQESLNNISKETYDSITEQYGKHVNKSQKYVSENGKKEAKDDLTTQQKIEIIRAQNKAKKEIEAIKEKYNKENLPPSILKQINDFLAFAPQAWLDVGTTLMNGLGQMFDDSMGNNSMDKIEDTINNLKTYGNLGTAAIQQGAKASKEGLDLGTTALLQGLVDAHLLDPKIAEMLSQVEQDLTSGLEQLLDTTIEDVNNQYQAFLTKTENTFVSSADFIKQLKTILDGLKDTITENIDSLTHDINGIYEGLLNELEAAEKLTQDVLNAIQDFTLNVLKGVHYIETSVFDAVDLLYDAYTKQLESEYAYSLDVINSFMNTKSNIAQSLKEQQDKKFEDIPGLTDKNREELSNAYKKYADTITAFPTPATLIAGMLAWNAESTGIIIKDEIENASNKVDDNPNHDEIVNEIAKIQDEVVKRLPGMNKEAEQKINELYKDYLTSVEKNPVPLAVLVNTILYSAKMTSLLMSEKNNEVQNNLNEDYNKFLQRTTNHGINTSVYRDIDELYNYYVANTLDILSSRLRLNDASMKALEDLEKLYEENPSQYTDSERLTLSKISAIDEAYQAYRKKVLSDETLAQINNATLSKVNTLYDLYINQAEGSSYEQLSYKNVQEMNTLYDAFNIRKNEDVPKHLDTVLSKVGTLNDNYKQFYDRIVTPHKDYVISSSTFSEANKIYDSEVNKRDSQWEDAPITSLGDLINRGVLSVKQFLYKDVYRPIEWAGQQLYDAVVDDYECNAGMVSIEPVENYRSAVGADYTSSTDTVSADGTSSTSEDTGSLNGSDTDDSTAQRSIKDNSQATPKSQKFPVYDVSYKPHQMSWAFSETNAGKLATAQKEDYAEVEFKINVNDLVQQYYNGNILNNSANYLGRVQKLVEEKSGWHNDRNSGQFSDFSQTDAATLYSDFTNFRSTFLDEFNGYACIFSSQLFPSFRGVITSRKQSIEAGTTEAIYEVTVKEILE